MLTNKKLELGMTSIVAPHKDIEHGLGYEIELAVFEGLPIDRVHLSVVTSTRRETPYIRGLIENGWEMEKKGGAFDKPRARFEGCEFDTEREELLIKWSPDCYKNHSVLRKLRLTRDYQACLLTINGIILTFDRKIPLFVRNPHATDQGRIIHTAPAGFNDLIDVGGILEAEGLKEAVIRKLFDEIMFPGFGSETPHAATRRELHEEIEFPQGSFDPERMLLLGIVFNWLKNFDFTTTVLIPLDCESGDIAIRKPKGKKKAEHEEIIWENTDLFSLKRRLTDLSISPETNSGHLRGDIALLIGHLFGRDAYLSAIEDAYMRVQGFITE